MRAEFDPAKDASNIQKHGVSLTFGIAVLADPDRLSDVDSRHDYGEKRVNVLGRVGDRVYVVTYTQRGDALRIISVRKANRREQRRYDHAQGQS
ncbi:BrnT family toxin [Azospirillum sp. sgz301742]